MSQVQVIRGSAALPADLEEQFVQIHGREMTLEEREFFGLPSRRRESQRDVVEHERGPQAA